MMQKAECIIFGLIRGISPEETEKLARRLAATLKPHARLIGLSHYWDESTGDIRQREMRRLSIVYIPYGRGGLPSPCFDVLVNELTLSEGSPFNVMNVDWTANIITDLTIMEHELVPCGA